MQTPSKGTRGGDLQGSDHQYHQKCVCEICTCGRHTCPEKGIKFEGETTNHRDYKPYDIVPEKSQKYAFNPQQKHYDPNLIQTTYHANYVPYQIEKPPLQAPLDYHPSRGKFEDETQYNKNYVPTQISAERPIQRLKYAPNNAKFQGSTTYNREYSPKHAVHQQAGSKRYEYRPSNIRFEGQTTYQSQYKAHKIETYRPDNSNRYQVKNSPFVGESRYKQEYVPYKIEVPQKCATQLLPTRPLRCSPGKEHLHFTASRSKWE